MSPSPLLFRGLGIALAAALLACASDSGPEPVPHGALSRITTTGELRVGTTGEQPPLSMTTKGGELFGLDVALARVLAQSMGVEAKFVRLEFNQLLDALEQGRIDMVISGMTITPERIGRVALVGPYFTSGKTILTKSEDLAAAEIPQELDSPDLTFVALAGSTSEVFVRRSLPSAKLVTAARLEDAIQQVIDGRVDALVADRETCRFAVLRNPDAGLEASKAAFTVEPMGIAVPLDQPNFANLIQSFLTALDDRGTLEEVRAFWFRDPSWVKDLR